MPAKSDQNLKSPSDQTWRRLYAAATAFKDLSPWEWMWDSDMLAVRDPSGNEVGYCVALGRNGEFFGLEVCLGEEGLEGFAQIQSGMIHPEDLEVLHTKNCLLTSFEDRKYLDKNDLKIIKRLGLTFRGKDSWPKFRHYEPGLFPWYISEDQAVFLTRCLEQTMDVAIRFRKSTDLLEPKGKGGYFTRVPAKQGEDVVWHDEWILPEALHKVIVVRNSIDEAKISNIFSKTQKTGMTWEADYFWAPMPVRDGKERPYYPVMYMLSDHDSYFILDMQLESKNNYGAGMGNALLRTVEKQKVYPKKIIFRKPLVGSAFGFFAERFDIKLQRVEKLKAIDDARREAFGFFKGK